MFKKRDVVFMKRIRSLFKFLAEKGLEAAVIKNDETIRYLTGFTGDSSLLYVDKQQIVLITDGRYTEQAENEMKFGTVHQYSPGGEGTMWKAAAIFSEGQEMLAFDGNYFTFDEFMALKDSLKQGMEFISLDFRPLRLVKDESELENLWEAFKISDRAFEKTLTELEVGMTEKEIAARLEYYMSSYGSEGVSFPTIVASGARSALPHGAPTDKIISVGDFVTFDFGTTYKGYHSDTTRTVVMGMGNSWHKEIYNTVAEAQYRGIRSAKPGMTGKELDEIVRSYIESCGYGEYFNHGLGHGVGLEIHELPNINRGGDIVLQPGMVFSIEPGIYIPGKGGVRIEDTVVLTEEGARSFTNLRKGLLEIV